MPPYEMCRFSKHKSCRKSQRMTDHSASTVSYRTVGPTHIVTVWQTIREEMIGYMEEVRTKRLEQERFALLSARLTILQTVIAEWEQAQGLRTAETDWEPLFSDFAFMDIFRSLVEAPSEQIVRKQDFEAHLDDIPGMIESWLMERRLELAAKVPITPTNEVSPLSLAVASFSCKRCFRGGLRWPQILAHTCARVQFPGGINALGHQLTRAITIVCFKHLILPPWPSTGHTGFIIQRHERMCEVIRACGRDPAVATHEDMESCGVRLICRKCVSPHGPCEVLDWKDAVRTSGPLWVFDALTIPMSRLCTNPQSRVTGCLGRSAKRATVILRSLRFSMQHIRPRPLSLKPSRSRRRKTTLTC